MLNFLLVCISLGAAIVFGFVSAAAMATDLGLAIVGAVAALIVLSGAFQGTALFAQTRLA